MKGEWNSVAHCKPLHFIPGLGWMLWYQWKQIHLFNSLLTLKTSKQTNLNQEGVGGVAIHWLTGLFLCLHILPVPAWVLSKYSSHSPKTCLLGYLVNLNWQKVSEHELWSVSLLVLQLTGYLSRVYHAVCPARAGIMIIHALLNTSVCCWNWKRSFQFLYVLLKVLNP